jgi:hypothetical protein
LGSFNVGGRSNLGATYFLAGKNTLGSKFLWVLKLVGVEKLLVIINFVKVIQFWGPLIFEVQHLLGSKIV